MKELLKTLCIEKLQQLNQFDTPLWANRFNTELQEVISKGDVEYFLKKQQECLDLKIRYENEFNSIIPFLLGICNEFDITKSALYDYGESPDIDVDYIGGVREYLKEEFAKKEFGEDHVCNICSYNTFGMKGALKDIARVLGLDHKEVNAITKGLKDKDDDNEPMTWEQALELFDDLREYCDKHPELKEATEHMLGRIRSQGQHASGLVVSSVKISDHVPLIRGKEGSPASAWIEGLQGTDLSTVGFIKFDFLGLDGNSKIATTCKMACQDKKTVKATELLNDLIGDKTVCALPGLQDNGEPYPSWSDISYLNDDKCMDMAKKGDLRMIFQFDGSPGIRRLAKQIGCDTFEDLVATTALFRPGPMKLGCHEEYVRRKNGEPYEVHPLLAEGDANLKFTHNVLIYQEQVSRLLNTIGKVPWKDCDVIRKAISKKKIDKFQKYKETFITGGQETLGATKEELEHLWARVESFSTYGFNLSVDKNTLVNSGKTNKKIKDFKPNDTVLCIDESGKTVETKVINLHDHGMLDGYEITLDDGSKVTCTMNHKFLTEKGQKSLWDIIGDDYSILCNPNTNHAPANEHGMLYQFNRSNEIRMVDMVPRYAPITDTRRLVRRKVIRIVPVGKRQMYDLEVANPTHNYLLANGICTSNSHAVSYTYISSRMLWLKAHLPKRFFASMFTHTKTSNPKDYNKLREYKREADKHAVKMAPVDINKSKSAFVVNPDDDIIYYGFGKIKGIGEEAALRLEKLQPYADFEDFLDRFGTDAKIVQALIALGCFSKEGDKLHLYKFYETYKKFINSVNSRLRLFNKTKAKIEEELKNCTDPDEGYKIQKRLDRHFAGKEKKDQFVVKPTLANFDPAKPIKLDEKFLAILDDPIGEKCELEYYGYIWHHPIERNPEYQGHTFDEFLDSNEKDGLIEAIVRSVKKTKGPRATYYSVQLEDATGENRRMTVWENDYLRFEEEFKENYMVRLHVDVPKPPYPTFTLHQLGSKWKMPPRLNDHRVVRIG